MPVTLVTRATPAAGSVHRQRRARVSSPGGLPVADLSGSHDDQRTTGKIALNWKLDTEESPSLRLCRTR